MLLCVAMVSSLLTVGAVAEEGEIAGTCGENAYWSFEEDTATLAISGHGPMADYRAAYERPYHHLRDKIKKVLISDAITHIGDYAFGWNDNLEELDIGSAVKSIGNNAIASDKIETLVFPIGVQTIGYGIWISYNGTISVPRSVTRIGTYYEDITINEHTEQFVNYSGAFSGCKEINVESGNNRYFSVDGVLYEKCENGKYNLICYPRGKTDKSYSVIDGTQEIVMGAFTNAYISQVIMPTSLKRIGMEAFFGCNSLFDLQLNTGLEKIFASAFWNCISLTRLDIPASVNYFAEEYVGLNGLENEMPQPPNLDIYFYGNTAPDVFNAGSIEVHTNWNNYDEKTYVTIHYPQTAAGWVELIDKYDEYQYTLNGEPIDLLNFESWNPGPVLPQIVELSPANGASISETASTDFMVTYDTPISAVTTSNGLSFPELDFSKGTIEFYRVSDNELIYSVEADPYLNELYDIEGIYSSDIRVENSNTLVIKPFNVHTLFDAGEEYYVTVPAGFFTFANGITNDAIEKGEWTFTAYDVDRNFILGEDNNSYIHSRRSGGGFEGTNDYSFKNKDILNYLRDGKDFITWLNITLATRDTVLNSWNGCCYGVAATMALVYNEVYDVSDINESNAKTYYEMPWPCEDDKLHDIINYYQVTQSFGGKVLTAYANSPNEGDVLEKLIELLDEKSNDAILFAYHYIDEHGESSGHTILALDYTVTETGDYSVCLYDENTIGGNNSLGGFVYMEISDDFDEYRLVDGNGETLCPETCVNLSLVETENIPALPSMLNNYSASSSSTSTGDDSATIVVSFVDGIQLTNEKGETLYAGEKGIPTGSMQIIDMTPIIYGPEDTSNEWLLKVAPFEDLYIESSGETVDIWYASNERGYSIIGDNLSGAIISVDKGIELTPSSGSTANVQLGLASADVGNALVDITASVTEHSTVELQADGRSSFVSLDGGIDNINATLLTSDGDKRLESTYSDNSTHIDIDVDGVDMPNWPAIDAPVGQGPSTEPDEPAAFPFADVARGSWYYDAVAYVYANGLMDGVSGAAFNPDGQMTRAMVWTILARIDGEEISGANWQAEAREWAMTEDVSDGTDSNGIVTREQFATMLYRYAGEPEVSGDLSAYTDADRVSDWATDAMLWATQKGIVAGLTATTLDPQGTATRAQAAAMLMRFIEL